MDAHRGREPVERGGGRKKVALVPHSRQKGHNNAAQTRTFLRLFFSRFSSLAAFVSPGWAARHLLLDRFSKCSYKAGRCAKPCAVGQCGNHSGILLSAAAQQFAQGTGGTVALSRPRLRAARSPFRRGTRTGGDPCVLQRGRREGG